MKIIKKKMPMLLIYVFVFLTVLMIVASQYKKTQQVQTSFVPVKTNIAIIREESSPLIDGLMEELAKKATFSDIPDKPEALQDALFFRSVTYIIRIPRGFTEQFMRGADVAVEKTVVPDSISNIYIDMCINQYFNTARAYVDSNRSITQEKLVTNVKKDLSLTVPVILRNNEMKAAALSYSAYYFNYLAYVFLSVLILGISALMVVFNNTDLKKRNACSPISSGRINLQFILANLLFTFAVWVIMSGSYFIFDFQSLFSPYMGYFFLNSIVFAFCAASISYLIGISVKSQSAVSAVSNVVALGSCFLSGVFVPQEFIAGSVLQIASFTPTYWYVKANNRIAELSQFDFPHASVFLSYILIEFGFAVAFFVLALVVGKKRNIRQA
jgi:ABC-2 type transport system permease protein